VSVLIVNALTKCWSTFMISVPVLAIAALVERVKMVETPAPASVIQKKALP